METTTLLIIYSLAIFLASVVGGFLPSLLRMTHTRTQLMMSFVAGLMLGVAIYHLLPHAIATIDTANAVEQSSWWLMIGLLFMFVLLRTFHFHQHDAIEEDHHHQAHKHSHPLSWTGVAFGLALHTLIDGIALGAAIQSDLGGNSVLGLFGIGVFAAIVLHKPLDAMSITAMMKSSGWTSRATTGVNIAFALMCPLGALLFFWGIDQLGDNRDLWVGSALAFSAGVFLCISLSDLLPEIQFHSHDRGKLTLSLLLGIGVAYAIGFVEPSHVHPEKHTQHELQSHTELKYLPAD